MVTWHDKDQFNCMSPGGAAAQKPVQYVVSYLKKKKCEGDISIDRYSVCMCVSTSINTPIITAATVGVLELCPWWGQVMCKAFVFFLVPRLSEESCHVCFAPLPHPHLLSGGFPPLVITWCVSPASSYLPEPLVTTYPYHSYLLAGPLSPVFFTLSVLCSFFFFFSDF